MGRPRILEVAGGVYAVTVGRGPAATNVYLIRSGLTWTLVDAGWFGSAKSIRAAIEMVVGPGAEPASMILTHLHPDHSGATRSLARIWRQPAYVHPNELPLVAGYTPAYANPLDRWLIPLLQRLPRKIRAKIAAGADLTAVVHAFDPAAGVPGLPDWTAVHTPGHTPGHISLFRSSDGVVITGDAVTTVDLNSVWGIVTARHGVFGPPRYTTWDERAAHESIRVLAGLEPKVLTTGHGRAELDGPAAALRALAAGHGRPARWRQGLFAPVDYSARTRYRPPPPLYQRVQKRLGPLLVGLGIGPADVVVLEVPGRRSAVTRRSVLVQARHDGSAYLVALAGESEWVRNVRAADGHVMIGRRQRRAARLVEVPPPERPAILGAYLLRWGRRPDSRVVRREAQLFFGVSGNPSLEELDAIAARYPVFRIVLDQQADQRP